MKIGIDCRMWGETGIGRYIRNIVAILSTLDTDNSYVLFVLSKDLPEITLPDNFELVITNIRWHSFKEQLLLPVIFYKSNLDVLFVPNLNVPILYFGKLVVTIHDLTVTKIKTGRASTLPYFLYFIKRLGVKLTLFFAIHRAKRIFTVSHFVKNEILNTYKIKESKLILTPCAVSNDFKPSTDNTDSILNKYHIKRPYLFYVGNAHPHKNIESLITVFIEVHKVLPDITLVLGGNKKFFYERIEEEWQHHEIFSHLNFIGFVADSDLPTLYSKAAAFVNASLYEGFGIQLLEAFACGTKVVCSNTTSLPEVGGNIAYYFNPRDINNMASSIISCLKDSDSSRRSEGFNRVKLYSWKYSGEVVYKNLVSLK